MDKKQKQKSLLEMIEKINANLGDDYVYSFNEAKKQNQYQINGISTGLTGLDYLLGTNGIVLGRIYELYGPESHGKTSLALTIVASFQKQNFTCVYIDVEHTLNYDYAKLLGVKPDELILAQPQSCENTWKIINVLLQTNKVNLIIVDSVASMVPEGELNIENGENSIGLQARLMSKGLRQINSILAHSKCAIIFVNQLRANINYYGSNEVTPGGRALKFYASVRMEVRRAESIYEKNNIIGSKLRIKIFKNKIHLPFLSSLFTFYFQKGFDYQEDLINNLLQRKLIQQKGPYYYFENIRLSQGKEKLKIYLKNYPEMIQKILKK